MITVWEQAISTGDLWYSKSELIDKTPVCKQTDEDEEPRIQDFALR